MPRAALVAHSFDSRGFSLLAHMLHPMARTLGSIVARAQMTSMELPLENKIRVPMTSPRVTSTIRELNRVIAYAEAQRAHLGANELRWLLALRERRYTLRLLLVARRIECTKKVVSLEKWRNGFRRPLNGEPNRTETPSRWVDIGQENAR
jgi:hypothetical protein